MIELLKFILLPSLVFALANTVLIYFSRRPFGKCIPLTLLISVFLLFFSQLLLNTFKVGIILLLAVSLAGLVILILNIRKKEFRELYFSIGFISFILIVLVFGFIDYGRSFNLYDEFQHWGKMIKEMYRTDHFYLAEGNLLLSHHDYPPFVTLFEMLWCKLSLGYSEGSATLAMHVLEYSLLIPVISENYLNKEKGRKFVYSILCLFLIIFVVLMFDMAIPATFVSVYIDITMPIFYAYGILLVLDRKEMETPFGLVSLLLIQSSLILSKQMSIAFVMLIWLFYTLKELPGISIRKIIKSVLVIAVPLCFYVLWSKYVEYCGYHGQFELSKISISGVIDILKGIGTDAQIYTYYLYRSYLLRENLINSYIPLSYIFVSVLFFGILVLLYLHKKNNFDKAELIRTILLYIAGTAGYALTMFLLYMYCFSEDEMMILASYSRYMSSFLIGEALVIMILILHHYEFNQKKLGILLLVMILCTNYNMYRKLKPQRYNAVNEENARNQAIAEEIEKYTQSGDTLLFLCQEEEKDSFFIGYYLNYTKVDTKLSGINVTYLEEEEYDTWSYIEQRIMSNNYVYITETSDVLRLKMSVFTDDEITDNSLYKVIPENGWARLEKIY